MDHNDTHNGSKQRGAHRGNGRSIVVEDRAALVDEVTAPAAPARSKSAGTSPISNETRSRTLCPRAGYVAHVPAMACLYRGNSARVWVICSASRAADRSITMPRSLRPGPSRSSSWTSREPSEGVRSYLSCSRARTRTTLPPSRSIAG